MSAREDAPPPLPGPPPAVPDLAAVSASVEPPARPVVSPPVHVPAAPQVEPPSTDVAGARSAPRLPGAPIAGYVRLPTAPVATTLQGPVEGESLVWAPVESAAPRPIAGPWALGLAIVALVASFAVGWMLPLGLIAVIVALIGLRRPVERRSVIAWALVLGLLSVLYSAGWLVWAAWRSGLIGG